LADFESYEATADAARAKELAATSSPFKIKIRFLGGLNARQRSASRRPPTVGRASSSVICPERASTAS
jgi:hypothetical protein